MDWIVIDYDFYTDSEGYTIVNFAVRDDPDTDFKRLESVKTFLKAIESSYRDKKHIEHQAVIDLPREKCYINGEEVKSYSKFVKEIKYTKLLKEAILVCTQASLFPVTEKLFEEYQDAEQGIHVVDYRENNPVIMKFWIHSESHIRAEIQKKFKVVQFRDGEPEVLRTLVTNITLDLEEDKGDEIKDVQYSIRDDVLKKMA